jgi:LacI family transcriptional regulator
LFRSWQTFAKRVKLQFTDLQPEKNPALQPVVRRGSRMLKSPTQRVSLSSIAGEAGVSVSTVSRIANGQLNRANTRTIQRVQTLIETRGYRPDNIGRSLRCGESRIIAMLSPNLNNPAMGAIATSTEAALRKAGFVMILCDTHDEPALQDEYLIAMRAQSVQGYVVVSAHESPVLSSFIDCGESVVLVGRRQKGGRRTAPFVGIDDHAAGAAAADFLLGAGIASPAVIHTSTPSSVIADRVAGFLQRLTERGVPAGSVRCASSDQLQHLFAGYEAMQRLTAQGGWPEGLFCVSDLMAYGAYRHAGETGVSIPGDCLVVGVDDNHLNAWIAPWLSSVHVPYEDFGTAVLGQLRALWDGGSMGERLLPHRLVARHGGAQV